MIIVKLIGGLGNQMFQYAAGLSLAIKLNTDLKLDIGAFQDYKLHKFMLDKFKIQKNIASKQEIKKIIGLENNKIIKKIYLLLGINQKITKEKYFYFNDNFFNIPTNSYLEGYWQSEKYFKNIKHIIKNEFRPINKLVEKNFEMAELINKHNAVSIHIRRGDYVSNQITNSYHGTCSLKYYEQAIQIIKNQTGNPIFFIFSDDQNWTKENLKIDFPHYFIDFNGPEKNYEDLRLMSLCKHNIIANSSFSWWGAWLNENPNKIVIAPKKWFNDATISTTDLIPQKWTTI